MDKIDSRQAYMGVLAKAPADALQQCVGGLGALPEFDWVRPPELGGVMVRGRAGGTGSAFNMGEMTITRCALRLKAGGAVGHAYVQGRDKSKAQFAALVDALIQTDQAATVRAKVLEPLARQAAQARAERAEKAAATKVDFFTLVRGED